MHFCLEIPTKMKQRYWQSSKNAKFQKNDPEGVLKGTKVREWGTSSIKLRTQFCGIADAKSMRIQQKKIKVQAA